MDNGVVESIVYELTTVGDVWELSYSAIFLLRGVHVWTTMEETRLWNSRVTVVLETIMAYTGQLVTDAIVDEIIAFVNSTATNDLFNE